MFPNFLYFCAGTARIGQQFAMSELKTATAVLLRQFCFTADASKPVQRINKSVLRSTTGVHVLVSLRKT